MDEQDSSAPPRPLPSMPSPFVPAPRVRPPPLPLTSVRPASLWRETLEEHRNTPEIGEALPLGGWLVLVAIGRVLAVPFALFSLLHLWQTYSKPGLWSRLTTPGSPGYHPLWAPTIVYEVGGKAVVLLWSIVLVWLFFGRKKAFRPWYIAYSLLLLVYLWGDHFLAAALLGGRHSTSPDQLGRLVGYTVSALIWVPYFFVSDRVRETFVR